MDRPPPSYGHVAWCYDAIASGYSLGAIGRAKRWHVPRLKAGDRVLYVGAGTGREVAAACRAHPTVEVVCIDPCPAMARRLRRRLAPWADRVTIIDEPLRAAVETGVGSGGSSGGVSGGGGFDWVSGHFFFNVFDAATMPGVLAIAASHVKPGGRMVVADFAAGGSRLRRDGRQDTRPTQDRVRPSSWVERSLREGYYRPVNVAGWGLGMCALHPIYDYGPVLEALGFEVEARVGVRSFPGVPALYEVVCGRKKQGG